MEISTQIKKYRTELKMTQEELANKIFVTRQTVSNWENDKNYPDIHSLLLLGSLFNLSLDQLIKGDIEKMKDEINELEIRKLNRYGKVYATLFFASIVLAVPLFKWLRFYGILIWVALFGITLFYAFKVERVKKDNNIQTYKEITAFTEGKRLDEIEMNREFGKRTNQKVFLAVASAIVMLIITILLYLFFINGV